MTLPITVRKTTDEPPTRPLTPLERAEAEIVRLRALIDEKDKKINMLWAELLNAQYEALRRVERVGAKLGKHTKSVKTKKG